MYNKKFAEVDWDSPRRTELPELSYNVPGPRPEVLSHRSSTILRVSCTGLSGGVRCHLKALLTMEGNS